MQAVVAHKLKLHWQTCRKKRATQLLKHFTAVEKGVVARTEVHSQFMRDMAKDAEAKEEYDACTGRVTNIDFRRAWAQGRMKVVETHMSQSQSLVKKKCGHGLPRILAHLLLQANKCGTHMPRCTSPSTLKMAATK